MLLVPSVCNLTTFRSGVNIMEKWLRYDLFDYRMFFPCGTLFFVYFHLVVIFLFGSSIQQYPLLSPFVLS